MTNLELIAYLQTFPKDLPVRIEVASEDTLNYWVRSVEVHGGSGYEEKGEIVLMGEE